MTINPFKRSPWKFYRSVWPAFGAALIGYVLVTALGDLLLFVALMSQLNWTLSVYGWLQWFWRLTWAGTSINPGMNLGSLFQAARGTEADAFLRNSQIAAAVGQAWLVACLAGLAFTVPLTWLVWLMTPRRRDAERVEGFDLIEGENATKLARQALREPLRDGSTIELAPGLPLPKEREVRSVVLFGGQRSGKTVTLRSWLRQLIAAQHKLVVHDTKGDMTATWPSNDFILLAPQDARSWAWDIGRDIVGGAAAFELATTLIPTPDKEPIWAEGAQHILTGILIALQRQHGTSWGWRELNAALEQSPEALSRMMAEHYPMASQFVAVEKGEYTRSAASFVTSLMGPAVRLIQPLAAAWGDLDPRYRLSLREWVQDSYEGPRTLILQRSPEFSEMSRLWIAAVISRMVAITGGANFPDSRTRRIWLALDEFPQLGKIKGLFEVPSTHAAKGVTLALALQSLGQLTEAYGTEARRLLGQLTGTKILFRLQGEDAEYAASTWVGKWRYQKPERSWKDKLGTWFGESDKKWRPEEAHLLLASYFSSLKPNREGVEGLVVGLDGDAVYRLSWPYEDWPDQREPSVMAPWVTALPPKPVSIQTSAAAPGTGMPSTP